ncbi:TIGR02302 family protein [Marinovum sp. 2_MG-2023]|uniref:TIGR02302 family protein n=1 Tax=unclassified Marinovum TaxID=2647166 RepID=UPI0026E14E5F|nr:MULTISPECIES: TIGR02302 family protein [unclassified Marinovum]MDO6728526.1 TIGR02302 family protein [Marinovum sp. 2_MG-2023]MDO6778058.1 TIGR02302 family protein [Marinovum sp. 1_MG-2023]
MPQSRYLQSLRHIRGALTLTHLGLLAERVTRAFWPFWSVALVALALLMLGIQDLVSTAMVWVLIVGFALAGVICLGFGLRRFRWPSREEAVLRLDDKLPGRPLQSLRDAQVIGGGDAASVAVWQAHQARMARRAAQARAVPPDLRVSQRDPFALRYVAVLGLAVALLFGSFWKVSSVAAIAPGAAALAGGPTWEGWIEPPAYTGLPSLYLADQQAQKLDVAEGSRITLRLYGETGALTVTETLSGRTIASSQDGTDATTPDAADVSQSFQVVQGGTLTIEGPGGRSWDVTLIEDAAPSVQVTEEMTSAARGEMSLPFAASDDFGVRSGEAVISLNLPAVDRRYGLARDPEPRDSVVVPLPLPIAGSRAEFRETLIEDFSQHAWANLPVTIELRVMDDLDQVSAPEMLTLPLPGRRFFDPFAAAIIDQRRALLWSRENAGDVATILRAVTHRPDELFRSAVPYLRMRTIQRQLETYAEAGLTEAQRDELAAAMWDLAVLLEDGDLSDALERLRRAQERLSEAMKNGASDQEIAELMQELRDATQDYLRQLAQEQRQNGEDGQDTAQNPDDMMQMTQDDLQAMMDRIQELMEQGRMAEAEQAMRELQELLENMQVTQGQPGQGQQSPGQQAMDDLAETLREQQGLSDQAFRDLQEQFNPGANQGQSQGNEGRDGGMGQGQQHQQQGQGQGQGQNSGQNPGQSQGQQDGGQSGEQQGQSGQQSGQNPGQGGLADRQEALRRELERQRGSLPGQGSEAGQRADQALRDAERAMDGAEQALRGNDLAEALDKQAEAMEALREGMRNLGEAMAEEQRQQGGQGDTAGAREGEQRDPLGRNPGNSGTINSNEDLLQGEDVYRRARELLDEIRRRSGDGDRPEIERNYLERLLDRF